METKDLKRTKGITLISLVVLIIVLLILAGVSIMTLTGDNGLLTRTVGAKNKTTLAGMEEELNLAYMSVYTGKAGSGAINSGVSLDEIYSDASLPSEVKSHIIQIGNANTIRLREGSQSSVTILAEDGAITSNGTPGTNTVNIEIEEVSNENVYWLESDGVYYPMSIANSRVVLDKENTSTTAPTGQVSTGNEIGITFLDSGTSEAGENSSYVTKTTSKSENITTITLTASSAGSTKVIVKKGNGTEVGEKVEVGVTVTPVYTISLGTMTNGDVFITTSGHDTTENKKYASGTQIVLTATGAPKYAFEKWYDDETENTSEAQASRNITVNATTSSVTYTAFFSYKLYGEKVQLNNGNSIMVKGNNAIDDNWRLFYIDNTSNGYVHLIYGDYYPIDVQTDPDTGINTINLSPGSTCPWGVNSASGRLPLLKYLKNNSSYTESKLDTSTPAGHYESWNNLKAALTGQEKVLNGKTILVQGAPNITMWKDSWKEQGYIELVLNSSGNTETGYKIEKKVASETQNYSNYIDLNNDTGHNDTLYFPYKGNTTAYGTNADKAYGYWMASPGGSNSGFVCNVSYGGRVSCGDYYNYSNYYSTNYATRPVVSILKSDFQELFPSISIEK